MWNLRQRLSTYLRRLNLTIFGNKVALRINLLYLIYHTLSKLVFLLSRERGEALKFRDAAKAFAEEGFLVFNPYLQGHLLASLANKADWLFSQPDRLANHHRAEGVVRLRGSLDEFPELEAFIPEDIARTIEAYFRSHFKVFGAEVYRIMPTEAQPDSSFLWHFDNSPGEMVKLMVYLDDTGHDTGAFRLKPKALSLELKRHGFWDRRNIDRFRTILEDESSTRVFEGKIGTAILFERGNCVHKATFPETSHRDVVNFVLHPSLIPWREHLKRNRSILRRNWGYCVDPFTDKPLEVVEE